jgi:hypothetical protein
VGVAGLELLLKFLGFVKKLFEPKFVGLVNDDEEHLIVLGSGALRFL